MKIGDYVRTEYGIAKCIKATPIKENSFLYEFDREVYEDVFHLTASELEKYKSSPNIIDLIQAGDYVNGYLIAKVYDVFETSPKELKEAHIKFADEDFISQLYDTEIKSIVTKEQFGSLEYRIGENND